MAQDIDDLPHHSGRYLKEDSTTENLGDWIAGAGSDEVTDSLQAIEYEHHQVHAGDSFACWYWQAVSDISDKTIIALRTPNTTKWLHIIVLGSATAQAHFSIFENPAITDNTGAILPIYNRNRNSLNGSGVWDTSQNPDVQGQATYFTEATMGNVVGGTEIMHEHIGASEKKQSALGVSRGSVEFVLKQNEEYAVVIESVTDDDNTHAIALNWYEHANL